MLRLENVRCGYGGRSVLSGANLALSPGRVVGIVGPNGAGKSTLLRAAAGLLPLLAGRVAADGFVLSPAAPRENARRVGYLPQEQRVPELTVSDYAALGRYPWSRRLMWGGPDRRDSEAVQRGLCLAGAEAFRDRMMASLSGGERRRAYLAALLAQDAPYLLLDEPMTFLDPGARFEIMALLRKIAGEGRGVALILHDLPLALSGCDEIALVSGGSVGAQTAPEEMAAAGDLRRVFGVNVTRAPAGGYAISPCPPADAGAGTTGKDGKP